MKQQMPVHTSCTITFSESTMTENALKKLKAWTEETNANCTNEECIIKDVKGCITTIECKIIASTKQNLVNCLNKLLQFCKKLKGCCSFKSLILMQPELVCWHKK